MTKTTFLSRFCFAAIGILNVLLVVPLFVVGAWLHALFCLGGAGAGYLGGRLWQT